MPDEVALSPLVCRPIVGRRRHEGIEMGLETSTKSSRKQNRMVTGFV